MFATAAVVCLLRASLVQAQVFQLTNSPIPSAYSLATHVMFFAYSQEDDPSKSGASSTVEFRQLTLEKAGTAEPPSNYESVEVSLFPYDEFWMLLSKDRFCSREEDVRSGKAEKSGKLLLKKAAADTVVRTQSAAFGSQGAATTFAINATGQYILMISNCGSFSQATLTASVAVRNPYGYLPAYEFFTMRLFFWLMLAYGLVFSVWFVAMVKHYQGLFYIHKGICTIVTLCLLECFVTWLHYQDWNSTGERRDTLFVACLMFYTLKHVLAWRLILLASLGAGVVLQDLDTRTTITFFMGCTLFLVSSCMWKLIMAYRYSHALTTNFLMTFTVPGILIYLVMFMWALSALSNLIQRITEQRQEELALLFSRVRGVLIGALLLSFVIMVLQVVDVVQEGKLLSWEHRWIVVDGAPQGGFILSLLAMMLVWWPSEEGWKYGYMVQGMEEDGLEMAGGEGKHAVAAETIGMAEDDDML